MQKVAFQSLLSQSELRLSEIWSTVFESKNLNHRNYGNNTKLESVSELSLPHER